MEERFKPETELAINITNKFDDIKKQIKDVEGISSEFKKWVMTDLVDIIKKRFEKLEEDIEELNYKMENCSLVNEKIKERIEQVNSRIDLLELKRMEEKQMEAALEKLAGPSKVKINRKPLEELKK